MMRASMVLLVALGSGCVVEYQVTGSDSLAPDLVPDETDAEVGVDDLDTDPGAVPDTEPAPVDTDPADAPDEPSEPTEVDTATPAPPDDCTTTSDQIYLVDRDEPALHQFDPVTLQTTRLGALDCDWIGRPESMAVARDGVAWVRWSDDTLYEVDLATLDCTATGYTPGSFGAFGMGYATDAAGTWQDTLYIANASTLAALDETTWTRSPRGALTSQVELTGTSAGELWALAPLMATPSLLRLDKQTGATLETVGLSAFPDVANLDAFAFAHWGGEFFLFVRTYGVGESSDVIRVTRQGTATVEVDRMGLDIVGAGTSTCAPSQ